MNRNIAVILAGGSGSRVGGALPKQFLEVGGKTVAEHSIDAFEQSPLIDEIAIVCRPDYIPRMRQLVEAAAYRKVRKILPGGQERYHSSLAAIEAYPDDQDNLLFHDAVRPLVTDRIIAGCVRALQRHNAVDVATPTTDTIVQVDDRGVIQSIPPRAQLRNSQTPQCFKRGVIRRAYAAALADPSMVTTDDCGIVLRYLPTEPIHVVPGAPHNIKLTYAEDLCLIEKLLQLRRERTAAAD